MKNSRYHRTKISPQTFPHMRKSKCSSRKRPLLFAILLATMVMLAACIQPLPELESSAAGGQPAAAAAADDTADDAIDDNTVVRIGWAGLIDTLNPVATASLGTNLVHNLVYDSLYQPQLDGTITPEIAESVAISEDGKTWTITIHDDFTFADGEPLTAEDVAFAYNLYMNEIDSFLNPATEYFESVTAPDEQTVMLTLSEAIPNLESLLTSLPVLPEHIWSDHVDAAMDFDNADLIGSGPFTLTSYGEEDFVELVANKEHPLYPPKIDGLVLRYFEEDSGAAALLVGDVDMIYEVTIEAEEMLRAAEDIEVVSGPQPVIDDIIFNLTDEETCPPEDGICSGHPALRDRNVRLAMAHATNKEQIIDENLNGLGAPGLTLIPDSLGIWYNDTFEDYAFDIATANQILDEAGYLDHDGDGVREMPDGGNPLVFRVNWEGDPGEANIVADLLNANWAEIGIQTAPEAMDFDSLVAVCCPGFDFDIILWGWGSDLDPGFLLSVMTTDAIPTGMSETGYSNPEYDALFAEQAITLDQEKRREIIWRMQEIVHDDIVYIVPSYAENVQAYRTDGFQGWVTDGGKLDLLDVTSLSAVEAVE